MCKFFKKPKFINLLCMLLVAVFSINIAGCGIESNGVKKEHVTNKSIGKGRDIEGYTVYSESTFDKMTKELFVGYILNGRNFSLVVVPGTDNGDDTYSIKLDGNGNLTNKLFNSAQMGIYEYKDSEGRFINEDKKALLYYVTNVELQSWFDEFDDDDSMMSNTMAFFDLGGEDLEKLSRFKCKDLVNMGSGLNAETFCTNKMLINDSSLFSDPTTGGIVLFVGYGSIEGYITYNDIVNYEGSVIANDLDLAELRYDYYPDSITAFDFSSTSDDILTKVVASVIAEHEGANEQGIVNQAIVNNFSSSDSALQIAYNKIFSTLTSAYTEAVLNNAKPGYDRLKKTFELVVKGLLTDNPGYTLSGLYTQVGKQRTSCSSTEECDRLNALYEIISTVNDNQDLIDSAKEEAFNIKFSVALFSRYYTVIEYPDTDNLLTGQSYSKKVDPDSGNITFEDALDYKDGVETDDSYLLLVTAKGFTVDRGTIEQQEVMGWSDVLSGGLGNLFGEIARLDGCPNKTFAATLFELLANFKIIAGSALIVSGVTAATIAGIGLSVASVIGKLAAIGACSPVPGGRIVALVLIVIAGIIAIGAGLITLFSGLQDKARIEGLGASKENYCDNYVATFNLLFETFALTIPLRHYVIPKESDDSKNYNLGLTYCEEGRATSESENCMKEVSNPDGTKTMEDTGKKPVFVPMYYYADVEQSKALKLNGCPMLIYVSKGKVVDYIFGATTPEFIVEMLRLWGLMAFREKVYDTNVESDNKIHLYHTTNTNARTHTIKGLNYCYSLESNFNVYEASSCFTLDGVEHMVDNDGNVISDGRTNVGLNINYMKDYGNGTKLDIYSSGFAMPTSSSGLDKELREKLSTYFAAKKSFQFNAIAEARGLKLEEPPIRKEYTIVFNEGNNLSIWDPDEKCYLNATLDCVVVPEQSPVPSFSYSIHEDTRDTEGNKYILVDNKYVFKYTETTAVDGEIKYERYAMFKGTADTSHTGINKTNNEKDFYSFVDLLNYLGGVLPEDIADNDDDFKAETKELEIYFNVTVKEAPQANQNSDGKVCDADEYMYDRPNGFLWFDYEDHCVADPDVESKDEPLSTEDTGLNAYNYYSTSMLVGKITVSITDQGITSISIAWDN